MYFSIRQRNNIYCITLLFIFWSSFYFSAEAQTLSTSQINTLQLCATSAMASTANSGFAGSSGTRFTKISCDVVQNAMIVKIFNSVESLQCALQGLIASTTFSLRMRCNGNENKGNGITGSLSSTIINGTNVFNSAGVVLQKAETSNDLVVSLDDPNASIAGRTCTVDLLSDLWAQVNPGGICTACLNQNVLSVTQVCGTSNDDDDDCNYFNIACHIDQGTWEESSFFWLIFDLFIGVVAAFGYMIVLIERQQKMSRISTRVRESDSRMNIDKIDEDKNIKIDYSGRNIPTSNANYSGKKIRGMANKYSHDIRNQKNKNIIVDSQRRAKNDNNRHQHKAHKHFPQKKQNIPQEKTLLIQREDIDDRGVIKELDKSYSSSESYSSSSPESENGDYDGSFRDFVTGGNSYSSDNKFSNPLFIKK